MKRLKLNHFALLALILFVVGMGARRLALRQQMEELGASIETLRSQDELQQRMDQLMAVLIKADSDLRGLVITQDTLFINGFEEGLQKINTAFDEFMSLAVSHSVLNAYDTARIDSLMDQKILFMSDIKELCDDSRFEEAADKISTGIGKVLADSLWNIVHRSNAELEKSMQTNEQEYAQKSRDEGIFSILSFMGLLLLLVGFLYFAFLDIKKNEKIRAQLSEREEKLSITLSSISDAVLTTNRQGEVTYMNPVAQYLLSCNLEEVGVVHVSDVYKISDEGSGQPLEDIFEQVVVRGKRIEDRNHTSLHVQDKKYVIENNATPLRNDDGEIIGMVLVFRDVTERSNNLRERIEAEKEFRKIFEKTQEGIYRSTMDGKLILVNPSMANIFEFDSTEQMIAQTHSIEKQLYVDAAMRQHMMSELLKHGMVERFEVEVMTNKGKNIWIVINSHLVYDDNGEVKYVEGTVTDITQRKLDQENLERQYESLREYAFINSHEVRSHVATMLGLMNLTNSKFISEHEKEKVIDHLYEETTKLDSVIRRLSILINE